LTPASEEAEDGLEARLGVGHERSFLEGVMLTVLVTWIVLTMFFSAVGYFIGWLLSGSKKRV
jgi:hypothetical protein